MRFVNSLQDSGPVRQFFQHLSEIEFIAPDRPHGGPQFRRIDRELGQGGHPKQAGGVPRTDRSRQASDDVADFGRVQNIKRFDGKWDATLGELPDQLLAVAVLPIEDCKVAPCAGLFLVLAFLLDLASEVGGFNFLVSPGDDFDQRRDYRFALGERLYLTFGREGRTLIRNSTSLLRKHWRIVVYESKGTSKDGRERAPVLFESNETGARKTGCEQSKCCAGCSAKTVDGLIGVADRKYIGGRAGEQGQNLNLSEVGVLEFIDQQKSRSALFFRDQRGGIFQKMIGPRDHVPESAQVLLFQHPFDGGVDAGDLPAAVENFSGLKFALFL